MKILPADPAAVGPVSELLGGVFVRDPALLAYVSRSRRPRQALQAAFEVLLEEVFLPAGHVDTAWEGGRLLGAAAWTPPGSQQTGRYLRALPRLARALGPSLPRAVRLSLADAGSAPKFPHWYLFVIATSPGARGRGVGGALLDHGLGRAGDAAAYLEATTPQARALYERKGFVPLGQIRSPGPVPEVGMWKPPLLADGER